MRFDRRGACVRREWGCCISVYLEYYCYFCGLFIRLLEMYEWLLVGLLCGLLMVSRLVSQWVRIWLSRWVLQWCCFGSHPRVVLVTP